MAQRSVNERAILIIPSTAPAGVIIDAGAVEDFHELFGHLREERAGDGSLAQAADGAVACFAQDQPLFGAGDADET